MHGDNCVEGFHAEYEVFKEVQSFDLCQCFNGEYATYFAKSKMTSALYDCNTFSYFQAILQHLSSIIITLTFNI